MNCDRVRELVSDSLDGILPESLTERFHVHLSRCAPCRAFRDELAESLRLLEDLPALEVGEDFDEAVWKRVREFPRRGGFLLALRERVASWNVFSFEESFWRWSPVGVAAGILMMMVMASEPAKPVSRAAAESDRSILASGERTAAVGFVGRGFEEAGASQDAGMPEAVEAYLLRHARDLRLQADHERLLRSNYSYPLRRVEDPLFHRVSGGLNRPAQTPAVRQAEASVIAF
jgi:hypothetical protein